MRIVDTSRLGQNRAFAAGPKSDTSKASIPPSMGACHRKTSVPLLGVIMRSTNRRSTEFVLPAHGREDALHAVTERAGLDQEIVHARMHKNTRTTSQSLKKQI